MQSLRGAVDEEASRTGFSWVVRVDRDGETQVVEAYGFADRAHEVRNTVETQFAIASGSKGLTALAVMSLIERGRLEPATTARSLLGDDLPLTADDLTIEHLLVHRSGIGDYLDEDVIDDITDHLMPVSVHELATTEQFLPLLEGHDTDFLRSDELPGRAVLGYLRRDGLRTNVFHLPVLGSGDGGIYSTASDLSLFWDSLFAGRIVRAELVAEMVEPRSDWPQESARYGLGFHLHPSGEGSGWRGTTQGCPSRAGTSPRRRPRTRSSRTGREGRGR